MRSTDCISGNVTATCKSNHYEGEILLKSDLRNCKPVEFVNMPPFPDISHVNLVPILHHDLINEPYTNNDTGHRPEYKVKRPPSVIWGSPKGDPKAVFQF
jgi:hypothetical protein